MTMMSELLGILGFIAVSVGLGWLYLQSQARSNSGPPLIRKRRVSLFPDDGWKDPAVEAVPTLEGRNIWKVISAFQFEIEKTGWDLRQQPYRELAARLGATQVPIEILGRSGTKQVEIEAAGDGELKIRVFGILQPKWMPLATSWTDEFRIRENGLVKRQRK